MGFTSLFIGTAGSPFIVFLLKQAGATASAARWNLFTEKMYFSTGFVTSGAGAIICSILRENPETRSRICILVWRQRARKGGPGRLAQTWSLYTHKYYANQNTNTIQIKTQMLYKSKHKHKYKYKHQYRYKDKHTQKYKRWMDWGKHDHYVYM